VKPSLTHRKLPYWLIALIFAVMLGLIGLCYWRHTNLPTTVTPERTPELRIFESAVQQHLDKHPDKRNFGVKSGSPKGELGRKRLAGAGKGSKQSPAESK
jgi:hypothetical protein